MLFAKSSNYIRHTGSRSFDTFEKHTRANEVALIMYTTRGGGGGRGGQRIFFGGGFLKFFEEKVGDGKNFLKTGRGDANFFRCH